jgi:flagellar P-ring protein FlgI
MHIVLRNLAAALITMAAIQAQEPLNPVPPIQSIPDQGQPLGGSVSVKSVTEAPTAYGPMPRGPQILEPRIRNITRLHNSMPQALIGVGIVTGLQNTGSSDRGTRQALLNLIRREGLNLTLNDVIGGSTSLVSVTCTLPPFAKVGQQLDCKVEVLGDASSLRGGQLLRTTLRAVNGDVYAIAQGAVITGGVSAQGNNSRVTQNITTTGWANNAAQVVKDLESSFFSESGDLELELLNPTPLNAASVAQGIRRILTEPDITVTPVDSALVRIQLPDNQRTNEHAIDILNRIGEARVQVENPAKVVIDQASGTVIVGEGVLISPCVVGVSDVTIAVIEDEAVSQPNPFGKGDTTRVGRTRIEVNTDNKDLKAVGGGAAATVADLLQNLKTLGLTPPHLVAVFQALENAGYLHAELEVR